MSGEDDAVVADSQPPVVAIAIVCGLDTSAIYRTLSLESSTGS